MNKNKPWLKRLAASALTLAMAASLAACGGEVDITEVMTEAQENLSAMTSMHYDMTTRMDMSIEEENFLKMELDIQADYLAEPMTMKMEMVMGMEDLGSMATTTYVYTDVDGQYIMCVGSEVDGTMVWQKQALPDLSIMQQYDAKATLDLYLSSSESFVANGTEKIGDVDATRYDGVISKEAMGSVLDTTGMMDQFSSLGLTSDLLDTMLSELSDLPISIWIDEALGLPVRYELDMTEMMRSMMRAVVEELGGTGDEFEINEVFMSMTLSQFNEIKIIQIPADALAA